MPTGYPGIAGGHMPNSVNLPWDSIQNPNDKRFLSGDALRARFAAARVNIDQPIIATCGSGVTACILALSLQRLGKTDWKVYDGSWHEWAQRPEVPKVWGVMR
jgi:thiosulfate/3-mercaptopyruvate sulfurtransferase